MNVAVWTSRQLDGEIIKNYRNLSIKIFVVKISAGLFIFINYKTIAKNHVYNILTI